MKRMLPSQILKLASCLGAMACAAGILTARADTLITFSVDMSSNIQANTFLPGTDTVSVHGTFNNWSGVTLYQQGDSTVYTNTVDDTADANGTPVGYKFVDSNAGVSSGGWESLASGYNRFAQLPATSGAHLVLPTPFFADAGAPVANNVTFQVDVSQQIQLGNFIPGTTYVVVRGLLNGWGGDDLELTNDLTIVRTNQFGLVTTNVWDGTFEVTNSPAGVEEFKYVITGGTGDVWESPSSADDDSNSGNRFFANVAQTLPLVDFSDEPYAPIAEFTFSVDMSVVELTDTNYDPTSVTVWGSFNGWSGGVTMTNDPSAANANIFTTSAILSAGVGSQIQYQFRYNELSSGATVYDHLNGASGGNGNRVFTVPNVTFTNVAPVMFNDADLSDYLLQLTAVEFSVDMANAVGTDGHAFDPAADGVYINGQFANWYAWASGSNPQPAPSGYQMMEQGLSTIYTNTLLIPAGTTVAFQYKYGMDPGSVNGGPLDDEAGFALNHYRVVRATAMSPYIMPRDTFGFQYNEPYFDAANTAAAGLTILTTPNADGALPIQWLAQPGLELQQSASLKGPWQTDPLTDGTNWITGFYSTNGFVSKYYQPVQGNQFYRLIKQ